MDKRAVIRILIAALLLVGGAIPAHAWLIYHKPAFRGRVVDAETKAPIEGAVVVAVYNVRVCGPLFLPECGPVAGDVQEVLTDRNGAFDVPSHTFFHPWPFALGAENTDFIVFKPGYGSFPNWRVQPPKGMQTDFEEYFSRDLGAEKEVWFRELGKVGAELQRIKVTFGLVELPRLKTREERIKASMVGVTGYRSKDLPLLYRTINEEERALGLPERE